MNRNTTTFTVACFAVGNLLLAGCSQKEPAQQALAGVETAFNAAGDQAAKYVPEQYAKTKASVDDLKKSFDAKDYKTVMSHAPAALSAAKELAAAAAAKKDEAIKQATAEWTSLSASVPGLIAAVQSRIHALGNSKHPPAGVDLNAAKAALSDATTEWSKAQAASTAGAIEDAAALARTAHEQATAAATALKLQLPSA